MFVVEKETKVFIIVFNLIKLALNVLSNLSPRDLMNCAQTCKTWRHLADDNLLWSRKCKAEGINGEFFDRSFFLRNLV